MNKEDKFLLLQDLCARLPYGVKVLYEGQVKEVQYIEPLYDELKLLDFSNYTIEIEEIKPYLRPMSSMTDKEEEEYNNIDNTAYSCPKDYAHIPAKRRIDWLNAHHFDYRGLIEKGLAIEVTKDNNPYD